MSGMDEFNRAESGSEATETRVEAAVVGRRGASPIRLMVLAALLAVGMCGVCWCAWVYLRIEHFAYKDEAAPADVICVFGAAEYGGKPSPVLRARLEHALTLYEHQIAPMVLTLGGSAPGDRYSEGQVGGAYLMANGVPEKAIITETQSRSTEEQTNRLIAIARTNGFRRIVIVSDPTHLFRIKQICESHGVRVMTSPRPQVGSIGGTSEWQQVWHEVVAYTLWRLHLSGLAT